MTRHRRPLVWDPTVGDRVATLIDSAAEDIRGVNHLTITRPAITAPQLYPALADLARLGHGIAQALPQLAESLAASLDTHRTGMDDGGDPLAAVLDAADLLTTAAGHAAALGEAAARAQTVIARQHAAPHDKHRDSPDSSDEVGGMSW